MGEGFRKKHGVTRETLGKKALHCVTSRRLLNFPTQSRSRRSDPFGKGSTKGDASAKTLHLFLELSSTTQHRAIGSRAQSVHSIGNKHETSQINCLLFQLFVNCFNAYHRQGSANTSGSRIVPVINRLHATRAAPKVTLSPALRERQMTQHYLKPRSIRTLYKLNQRCQKNLNVQPSRRE